MIGLVLVLLRAFTEERSSRGSRLVSRGSVSLWDDSLRCDGAAVDGGRADVPHAGERARRAGNPTLIAVGAGSVLRSSAVGRVPLVLIPLGLARAAYYVAWLSRVTWRRDKPGGPAFAAALALVRQRRPSASQSTGWCAR